jgi:hypothetical protein
LLIDCKNRALIWLTRLLPSRHFNKVIACSRATLFSRSPSRKDRQHQRDADRRDALMKMESWRLTLLRRGDTPGSTWAKDRKKQLMVMESELSGRPSSETALPPKRLSSRIEPSAPYTIDIAAISPHPFYLTMKRKENEHFYTSIYDINRELESRNESAITDESRLRPQDQQPGEAELQWLRRLLPEEFKEYADVFSKEASNVLPPLRAYNHKIQL